MLGACNIAKLPGQINEMPSSFHAAQTAMLNRFDPVSIGGEVTRVSGLGLTVSDRLSALKIGSRIEIDTDAGQLLAEIIGLSQGEALALPFGPATGISRGARTQFLHSEGEVAPSHAWLGRVVDGLGRPIDDKGELASGLVAMPIRTQPPLATTRARLGGALDFGVKALNCFTPARIGQRLGIFSGAGVGKSALLGMIARNSDCDISIIALIGERGREVRDFLEDHLGPDGLSRSIVVVATSDEPAMMRREAALLALTLAEYFRDQGHGVLCLLDSLTRVAQAQREIGLAAGEPPTAKGYTPSVFSLLPSIIERAGPGLDGPAPGFISAVLSVLVEGDDHDEPIADAARSTLDGHIVLDRRIAERGRFPAVDILKSVSRAMPAALGESESAIVREIKALETSYDDMRELVRIGAYKPGSDLLLDRAIALHDELEEFLSQPIGARVSTQEAFAQLRALTTKDDIS